MKKPSSPPLLGQQIPWLTVLEKLILQLQLRACWKLAQETNTQEESSQLKLHAGTIQTSITDYRWTLPILKVQETGISAAHQIVLF